MQGRSLEEVRRSYLDLPYGVDEGSEVYKFSRIGGLNGSEGLNWEGKKAIEWIRNEERLVGGDVLTSQKYPQVVALIAQFYGGAGEDRSSTPFCTGSILDGDLILTAAHCDVGRMWGSGLGVAVCAGMLSLKDVGRNCQLVQAVYLPREYVMGREDVAQGYDLAVLKLDRALDLTRGNAKIIKYSRIPPLQGMIARAVGYGRHSINPRNDGKLRELDVKVVMNDGCRILLAEGKEVDWNLLCVDGNYDGSKGSACNGDSGGALIISTESVEDYYTVGVLSYAWIHNSRKQPSMKCFSRTEKHA